MAFLVQHNKTKQNLDKFKSSFLSIWMEVFFSKIGKEIGEGGH